MKADIYTYSCPIKSKGLFSLEKREGIFIKVRKKNSFGWGEIAPLPRFSQETLQEALEQLKEIGKGKKPPLFPSVSFGVQSALDSLSFQKIKTSFPLSSLLLGSAEEILKQLDEIKTSHCKIKVSHLTFSEKISVLKKGCEKKKKIAVDFNQKSSLEELIELASYFSPESFLYFEEPVKTIDELIHFSEKTHFPVALDESLQTYSLEKLLSIPSKTTWVYKPTLLGGEKELKNWAKLAKENTIDIVLSSSFETKLGLFHIAKLQEKLKLQKPMGLDTFSFIEDNHLLSFSLATAPFFTGQCLEKVEEKNLCHLFSVPLDSLL